MHGSGLRSLLPLGCWAYGMWPGLGVASRRAGGYGPVPPLLQAMSAHRIETGARQHTRRALVPARATVLPAEDGALWFVAILDLSGWIASREGMMPLMSVNRFEKARFHTKYRG